MLSLFNKNKKDKKSEELKDVQISETVHDKSKESMSAGSMAFSGTSGVETHKVLRGFYVSEKASMGMSDNQYMFKVFNNANKSEIKKEVSKLFKVEVKSVKVLNMPEKRRDFGKHPGSRSGFKKALVVLKLGHTIGQAKP